MRVCLPACSASLDAARSEDAMLSLPRSVAMRPPVQYGHGTPEGGHASLRRIIAEEAPSVEVSQTSAGRIAQVAILHGVAAPRRWPYRTVWPHRAGGRIARLAILRRSRRPAPPPPPKRGTGPRLGRATHRPHRRAHRRPAHSTQSSGPTCRRRRCRCAGRSTSRTRRRSPPQVRPNHKCPS